MNFFPHAKIPTIESTSIYTYEIVAHLHLFQCLFRFPCSRCCLSQHSPFKLLSYHKHNHVRASTLTLCHSHHAPTESDSPLSSESVWQPWRMFAIHQTLRNIRYFGTLSSIKWRNFICTWWSNLCVCVVSEEKLIEFDQTDRLIFKVYFKDWYSGREKVPETNEKEEFCSSLFHEISCFLCAFLNKSDGFI